MESCMLKIDPETIQDDTPLFGPSGLGLDSLDALQLTVAIEAAYKIPIKDAQLAVQILRTPGTIKQWVERQQETVG
jgi:acyl carrier protein